MLCLTCTLKSSMERPVHSMSRVNRNSSLQHGSCPGEQRLAITQQASAAVVDLLYGTAFVGSTLSHLRASREQLSVSSKADQGTGCEMP